MWRTLAQFVAPPTVVACLFLSVVLFVLAAWAGPVGSVLAGLLGAALFMVALGMVFAIYLKRINEDIDSERHDLRRDLDDILDDEN
ncbi:MAG: hypothetical protein ABEJ30_06725 [Halorientalis sp.]